MMKRNPPIWLCVTVLLVSLLWRMLGAPVTAEQFGNLGVPMTQARILLPKRAAKIWRLWLAPYTAPSPQTMTEEAHLSSQTYEPMIRVYLEQENRLAVLPLEGYVCGVLAAEMPVQYHLEALKAQAVAARTRALGQMKTGGCAKHPGADICTDSAHCQGYANPSECRTRWQENYEPYRDRILEAQRATEGRVLTHEGGLITVLYHAISGGMTEDAANVFSESRPYLISVESRGEEGTAGFWQDQTIPYQELARKMNETLGGEADAEEIRRSFSIGGYTSAGRVKSVQVAGHELSGAEFRRMLGLRSTWFTITSDMNGITFHQRGYGHGVGMSQAGANAMAADGSSYQEILLHYYPGVQIETHDASASGTGYHRRDAYAMQQPSQEQSAQALSAL